MLSVFNITVDGQQRPIAIIVLGSRNRKKDIQTLYRFLLRSATVRTQASNTIRYRDGVTYVVGVK